MIMAIARMSSKSPNARCCRCSSSQSRSTVSFAFVDQPFQQIRRVNRHRFIFRRRLRSLVGLMDARSRDDACAKFRKRTCDHGVINSRRGHALRVAAEGPARTFSAACPSRAANRFSSIQNSFSNSERQVHRIGVWLPYPRPLDQATSDRVASARSHRRLICSGGHADRHDPPRHR